MAGWGAGWALTVDDERGPLGGLLPRLDAVLVDGVLDLLQLLQRVQIRGFPLLLQLLADVGVAGEAAGGLRDLGLNGELAFQALQLGFLWERRPRLALGGPPPAPRPCPKAGQPSSLLGLTSTGSPAAPGPNPRPACPCSGPTATVSGSGVPWEHPLSTPSVPVPFGGKSARIGSPSSLAAG